MSLVDVLLLIALGVAAAFLWDSLRAREAANAAIRAACRAEGMLFLDDTVALESWRTARNEAGQLALRRIYGFDYSDDGNQRRHGTVTLLGRTVLGVAIEHAARPPDAPLH